MGNTIRKVNGFDITEYVGYQTRVSPYSNDEDQQGCCTSCVHHWDNSSDIFGECGGCKIYDQIKPIEKQLGHCYYDMWMYFNTEGYRCPLWLKTPKGIDYEEIGNYETIIRIANGEYKEDINEK